MGVRGRVCGIIKRRIWYGVRRAGGSLSRKRGQAPKHSEAEEEEARPAAASWELVSCGFLALLLTKGGSFKGKRERRGRKVSGDTELASFCNTAEGSKRIGVSLSSWYEIPQISVLTSAAS